MKYYIQDRIRSIFELNESPHRLALAFAAGIFIAFSPTIGLHMISCLIAAWAFRLNKVVVFTAAFINNPWTMVPMYAFCLWFGLVITGRGIGVPEIPWRDLDLSSAFEILKPYLWPFVAGTVIVGTVAAIASYALIYWSVVRLRRGALRMPEPSKN